MNDSNKRPEDDKFSNQPQDEFQRRELTDSMKERETEFTDKAHNFMNEKRDANEEASKEGFFDHLKREVGNQWEDLKDAAENAWEQAKDRWGNENNQRNEDRNTNTIN